MSKWPERVPLGILIGVVILIALTGLNVYETRRQRIELNNQITQLAKVINTRPANPVQSPRPSGPDPDKVYPIKLDNVPIAGSRSAPIQIVEISDFQ